MTYIKKKKKIAINSAHKNHVRKLYFDSYARLILVEAIIFFHEMVFGYGYTGCNKKDWTDHMSRSTYIISKRRENSTQYFLKSYLTMSKLTTSWLP